MKRIMNNMIGMLCGALLFAGCSTPERDLRNAPEQIGSMEITRGLEEYQVLQRDATNTAAIVCAGTCQKDGELFARVVHSGDGSTVTEWRDQGRNEDLRWLAIVQGIPVGGPYRLELIIRDDPERYGHLAKGRVLESMSVDNIFVGDIWVLAGQSNMQGIGDMEGAESPSPMVHVFQSNYKWAIAEEPLHRLTESPNAVNHLLMNPNVTPEEIEKIRNAPRQPTAKGAGLGLPFAKELYARTKVPIGLVPCAHGGTSMDQWDPAKKTEGGKSLYGAMLNRIHSISSHVAGRVGGKVKGILWYQGESDTNEERQAGYYQKMAKLIEAIRSDLDDPKLHIYIVQLGRVIGMNRGDSSWSKLQDDQRRIGVDIKGVVTIPAVDLELDDSIHIGTQGLKRLGRRLAIVADYELHGHKEVKPSIHFKSATVENAKAGVIRVQFIGVNGRLKPNAHIAGFSLRSPTGEVIGEFFDVMVDPKQPDTVICQSPQPIPDNAVLWYGYGTNPYCNLVDEQDMAVPVFGPVPLTSLATQKRP